jgi:hypothetical protein
MGWGNPLRRTSSLLALHNLCLLFYVFDTILCSMWFGPMEQLLHCGQWLDTGEGCCIKNLPNWLTGLTADVAVSFYCRDLYLYFMHTFTSLLV